MKRTKKIVTTLVFLLLVSGMLFVGCGKEAKETTADAPAVDMLEKSLYVDTSVLKAADGQPLLKTADKEDAVPPPSGKSGCASRD